MRVAGFTRWAVQNESFAYLDDPIMLAIAAEKAAAAANQSDSTTTADNAEPGDARSLAAHGVASAQRAVQRWTTRNASPASGAAGEMGTLVVPVAFNRTVDVLLLNGVSLNGVFEQHPWHKHGGAFWLLGFGGDYTAAPSAPLPPRPGWVVPMMDTLTLLPRGWAWIRFVGNNPGLWPWHCHIGWHLQMGMLTVFVVAPERVPVAG